VEDRCLGLVPCEHSEPIAYWKETWRGRELNQLPSSFRSDIPHPFLSVSSFVMCSDQGLIILFVSSGATKPISIPRSRFKAVRVRLILFAPLSRHPPINRSDMQLYSYRFSHIFHIVSYNLFSTANICRYFHRKTLSVSPSLSYRMK